MVEKLHDYIFREMAGNPAWKVIVLKNQWLCPFCGEIGARGLSMAGGDVESRIAEHLQTCADWDRGRGEPQDAEALQRRALLITFKHKIERILQSDPRWQFVDLVGCWICPYCSRGTDIELDEVSSTDDGARDHALTKIARHLLECPDCRRGEGKEKPREHLERQRDRINKKRQLVSLAERVEGEEAFRFRNHEKRWLCPFCARLAEFKFDREEPASEANLEGIWGHLQTCVSYRTLNGKPRTVAFLKERLIHLNREGMIERVRTKMEKHEVWRVRDEEGTWYCPYCGEPTGIRIPAVEAPDDVRLHAVWEHLSACPAYTEKARIRSADSLRTSVDAASRIRRIRARAEEAAGRDAAWRVADPGGSWFCPYCRRPQKAIPVSEEAGLAAKALDLATQHLAEECSAFSESATPATAADLKALVAASRPRKKSDAHRIAVPWKKLFDREMAEIHSRLDEFAEKEKSLREARSRQLHMLPHVPDLKGYEFACLYRPCETLSGDFYSFLRTADQKTGFALGDIAGHGVNAALLVGLAKKLFEIHGRTATSTAETLILANQDIYPDLDSKTFLTAFYGLLDTGSRTLRFSRAGHNPPILYNPSRDPRLQILDSRGMALGMDSGAMFASCLEELEIQLIDGDVLLEYTDGVVEAMNHEREEFGVSRLIESVERFGMCEGEYLLYKIEKAVLDFCEGARQKDDITMIALRVEE